MVEPITTLEEFEAEYRNGIGIEQDLNPERFLTETTRDNILNFCDAIGDNNPLWTDEEYARRARFGTLTAPPTFMYNISHGSRLSNVGAITRPILGQALLYASAEVEVFQPVRLGDRFTVTGKAVGITRRVSKSVGPMLFPTCEAAYFNQRGERVGVIRTTTLRYIAPKGQAIEIDRQPRPEVKVKSPDVLAFERTRRGGNTRYWEDVQVGQEMEPLEKGVLTMTEISRFGILCPPYLRRIEARREGVDLGFQRETQQKAAGLENASDYGPQRICWLGQLVTDWMGDDGTLKKLTGQIRHPNIIGDVNVLKGRVTRKYAQNGEHLVDLEIWVENQSGLVTAPGTAVASLPSKRC
jgi:acyl dehydratase